ncbi:MAG: hemerythrin family protein [Desulfovibrionaceae bacterium]|nr:hemerythrin family protein [Desulfovibrionaceae bacterium]
MLELTKDMETGVPKIDEQHKELINRINMVLSLGSKSVSQEETKKSIDFLDAYIIKHFGDEESLQRQSKYPKYEWHKDQHKFFVAEFKKLKEEFAANGPSAKFTVGINNFIIGWIVKHIKTVDVELGAHCRGQAAS